MVFPDLWGVLRTYPLCLECSQIFRSTMMNTRLEPKNKGHTILVLPTETPSPTDYQNLVQIQNVPIYTDSVDQWMTATPLKGSPHHMMMKESFVVVHSLIFFCCRVQATRHVDALQPP
jgi:hypothetical protein